MSTSVLKKDWVTAAGYRAVVLEFLGHNNGYVAIPESHPLFGVDYSTPADCLTFPADEPLGNRGVLQLVCSNGEPRPDVVFDVHGGLTFASDKLSQVSVLEDGKLWWYGFDCAHYGDANSPEYLEAQREKYPDMPFMWQADGVYRTVEYVTAECESLAEQLNTRVNYFLKDH